MTCLCKGVDHLEPRLVIWSCRDLKGKVSRALSRLLTEHGWIDSMSIAAYHIPNAVDPFKVPVPIEGLLFPLIKNPGVVDSIHQHAVLFQEKQDIKVRVKAKHDSSSMEEFPEIMKEPMGGESAKGDKGSGKNISAESDLDLKHLICLMKHPSWRAPCIPVLL
jgi:hypothetical protein